MHAEQRSRVRHAVAWVGRPWITLLCALFLVGQGALLVDDPWRHELHIPSAVHRLITNPARPTGQRLGSFYWVYRTAAGELDVEWDHGRVRANTDSWIGTASVMQGSYRGGLWARPWTTTYARADVRLFQPGEDVAAVRDAVIDFEIASQGGTSPLLEAARSAPGYARRSLLHPHLLLVDLSALFCLAMFLFSLGWMTRLRREHAAARRLADCLCPRCGYDLMGLLPRQDDGRTRCPECGEAVVLDLRRG